MSKVFTIAEGLENLGALKTGGQGSVYKARRTGVIVTAVKLLPTPIMSESLSDKNYIDFQNEVQKLKRVNEEPNPNVVKILSSGITETGSFPFIEMEFIEGPDLEELLKYPHEPVFTIKETIKVAEHLANALAHCHRAEVKHGDIKSNNVKLNIHTGNYVLLDFGLAVMSDEQRRTSLRQAGAIEFMAPEQGSGEVLFQTDVYSFGVILFELLAGQVPFPLLDKGETARNQIMLSHMETPPPNVRELRQANIRTWTGEKLDHELNVPQWLVAMIYRCLEKNPQKRFANGIELYEYVIKNSVSAAPLGEDIEEQLTVLREENKKLRQENEDLQRKLISGGRPAAGSVVPGRKAGNGWKIAALALGGLLLIYFLVNVLRKDETAATTTTTADSVKKKSTAPKVLGQYIVIAERAYFHNKPDVNTRRSAYLVPSTDVVKALKDEGEFIYTEFTNSRGKTSKGWVLKADLMPLGEWSKRNAESVRLTPQQIDRQLREAREFLERGETDAALQLYELMALQQVPEAMYYYGDLALRNENRAISCREAINFLTEAIQAGYTPAKKTMGILYLFGDDRRVMRSRNYTRCNFSENHEKGSGLLMEAALEGDEEAQQLLDELRQGE